MKFGEDGLTLEEGWQSELGDDLSGDKTLAEVKDVPGMAKMLVSAQKMVGADKIVLPGAEATEDEMNSFYTSLGRPAEPSEYGITKPEDFPEGLEFNEKSVEEYQKAAHALGLQPHQAKGIFDWYNELSKGEHAAGEESKVKAKEETENGLREKYGDKYTETVKNALDAARAFMSEEDIQKFNETGLGNAPWLIEAFAKVGAAIGEDKLSISHVHDNSITAQSEIDRIQGDLKHPYHNKTAPVHTAAVNAVQDLYKTIYPNEKG